VANGFVFVSGQIPVKPGGPAEIVGNTMQEQTRQALCNVQTILKAARSSLDRVVKVTVLLARPDLYKEMNEAYAEFFYSITSPARARIDGGTVRPSALAVFILNARSKIVGCSIGKSAGLAPLRILAV